MKLSPEKRAEWAARNTSPEDDDFMHSDGGEIENIRVQRELDEMNRLAFSDRQPPAKNDEKLRSVFAFVVASVAAYAVPVIPWGLTWIVVFGVAVLVLNELGK